MIKVGAISIRGALAALLLSCCGCVSSGSSNLEYLPWGYVRSGDRIGMLRGHNRGLLSKVAFPAGGETDLVFEPLHGTRGPVRFLEMGWATDGKSVWCETFEPEGKLSDWRALAPPFYVLGGKVRYGCGTAGLRDASGEAFVPFEPAELQVLGCRTVRYRGAIYIQRSSLSERDPEVSGMTATFERLPIEDPSSFRIQPGFCNGWDAAGNVYTIRPRGKTRLTAWKEPRPRSGLAGALGTWREKDGGVEIEGQPLVDADPLTFSMMEGRGRCLYGIDDRHVYFERKLIEGADPASFVIIVGDREDPRCFAYDRLHQYQRGQTLPAGDAGFETAFRYVSGLQAQQVGAAYLLGPGRPAYLRDE
jgi:hypothetical protein